MSKGDLPKQEASSHTPSSRSHKISSSTSARRHHRDHHLPNSVRMMSQTLQFLPSSYPISTYHLPLQYPISHLPFSHSCIPALGFLNAHPSSDSLPHVMNQSFDSPGLFGCPRWANLPRSVLETIFMFLNLADIRHCLLTCRRWNRVLSDECSDVWRNLCLKKLSKSILKSEILSSVSSYKAKLRAHFFAWDSNECSRNIYIKANGFTLHRNPVAQSTDAARGKLGLSRGRHCWEIWWQGPLGTVAVVGVATRDSPLQATGYVPLIGTGPESWGWNLVDNHLLHDGECLGSFPMQNNARKYQTGERLRVILDCDARTLAFELNGYEFLGIAFRNLPKKPLYPVRKQ